MENRLAFVEQKDITGGSDAVKVRYINDPRNEINPRTLKERHPFTAAPKHEALARQALLLRSPYFKSTISEVYAYLVS